MKRLALFFESVRVGRRFIPELQAHKLGLLGVGALSLLAVALEILRPWPVQWVFDRALSPSRDTSVSASSVVLGSAATLALIAVSRSLLQYAAQLKAARIGHAVTRGLRYRIFDHLTRLSPKFHSQHKSGDLMVRLMGDVPMLRTMLVDSSIMVATRSLLIVGTIGVMFFVDALLTLGLLATVPVFLLVVRLLSQRITIAVRKQRRKEGALADYLHESIAAAPVIQSLGRADHAVRRFARSNRTSARAGLKAARLAARMSASVESLLGVTTATTLALGSYRVLEGQLSPGELLVFLSYVRSLLKPVRSTSKHSEKVAKGVACGERIVSILDEPIAVCSKKDAVPAPAVPRELCFEGVSFGYGAETRVLHDFDARFARGQLTGLFGPSGAGKSTVAGLALRLFDPDRGCITLDGIDLREIELESLRECFGMCMQDSILFGESVRENILLGQPEASETEILAACSQAGMDELLAHLPEGLDTQLGSAGSGLSGGERRRLCLARALLRKAPIVIVDEPFAGLDRAVVARLRQSLSELSKQRIVIVIAHDLDHLDAFDRILFVQEGRLNDEGTHAELQARNRAYRASSRGCVPLLS